MSVQVGTYVSGPIQALYADYNTPVQRGQLLARIDPRPFQVKLDAARADLANARAQLQKSHADAALKATNLMRARSLAQCESPNAQHRTVQLHYDNIHCILLAKAGRLKEAHGVAGSMLAAAKDSANVRWEYLALQAAGAVEVRVGKIDEGLELLRKSHRRAASISPGMEVPAHLMLAEAYRYVGRPDDSLHVMREVSELLKKTRSCISSVPSRKRVNRSNRNGKTRGRWVGKNISRSTTSWWLWKTWQPLLKPSRSRAANIRSASVRSRGWLRTSFRGRLRY